MSRRAVLAVAALGTAGALLVTGCSPTTNVQASPSGSTPRTVSVSATGTADVVPDAAHAQITVTTNDPASAKAAQQAAANAATKVIDALKGAGVAEADIATQSINVGPTYNFTQSGGQELTGYQATQSLMVTLRDLTTAGATLDAVVAAGGNAARVDSLTAFVTDPTAAAEKARAQAVEIAKAQAEQYATLLGFTLGGVASVSEASSNMPPPIAMSEAAGAAPDAKVTPVQPGTTQVSVSLNVAWLIAD